MPLAADQLATYFERIGWGDAPQPNLETLGGIQQAHRRTIPFENLDIPMGRGIALGREQLLDKLVTRRRGGYCFEQNGVFLEVLRAIGFDARPLLARVWLGAETTPPRTHTLNLVRLEGEEIIADVGFGGSYMPLMPLAEDRAAVTQDRVRHRLVRDEDHGWMLERDAGSGWVRQYSFTTDRVWPDDLEAANHWTATRPGTRFTTLRVASMPLADGYVSLVDRTLTTSRNGVAAERRVEQPEHYRQVLQETFGIALTAEEVARLGLF